MYWGIVINLGGVSYRPRGRFTQLLQNELLFVPIICQYFTKQFCLLLVPNTFDVVYFL